jgi:hypothetical protein
MKIYKCCLKGFPPFLAMSILLCMNACTIPIYGPCRDYQVLLGKNAFADEEVELAFSSTGNELLMVIVSNCQNVLRSPHEWEFNYEIITNEGKIYQKGKKTNSGLKWIGYGDGNTFIYMASLKWRMTTGTYVIKLKFNRMMANGIAAGEIKLRLCKHPFFE